MISITFKTQDRNDHVPSTKMTGKPESIVAHSERALMVAPLTAAPRNARTVAARAAVNILEMSERGGGGGESVSGGFELMSSSPPERSSLICFLAHCRGACAESACRGTRRRRSYPPLDLSICRRLLLSTVTGNLDLPWSEILLLFLPSHLPPSSSPPTAFRTSFRYRVPSFCSAIGPTPLV